MKNISLIALFVICVSPFILLNAQSVSSCGFNAGGYTNQNLNVVLGQPFDAISTQNGYEVSEGVTQAQLVRENYNESVYYGEGYTGHGFSVPATTPMGTYEEIRYTPGGAVFGYDLLAKLTLEIMLQCGETVYDGDNNPYSTVPVAGYCWTQSNMRATHYADGTTEIAKPLVYTSSLLSDEATTVNTYGRLYTWYSAVGVPEDGSTMPTPDMDGYIQGICPNGWHIPTSAEIAALHTQSTPSLNATTLWIGTHAGDNTNSTGFTAVPAGMYNSLLDRYEGLGTQTDWWSDTFSHNTTTHKTYVHVFTCANFCPGLLENIYPASDAVSVRCVKNL